MAITREHLDPQRHSLAVYSDCLRYRYALTRVWAEGPRISFVMLNPSTATEVQNDPTVERCERRARAMGFGAFRVVNIFGFRATDPRDMRAAPDPIGPENDAAIIAAADWADMILCAWGTHGAHLGRSAAVAQMLAGYDLHHLGLTQAGDPKHPLYISYAQRPEPWSR
jgi:hypothetical protein